MSQKTKKEAMEQLRRFYAKASPECMRHFLDQAIKLFSSHLKATSVDCGPNDTTAAGAGSHNGVTRSKGCMDFDQNVQSHKVEKAPSQLSPNIHIAKEESESVECTAE